MSSWVKSFQKPYRILLGILAAAILAAVLWAVIPCHIAVKPEEIQSIRVEYHYEEVTGFDEAQVAEFLSQVMAQRRLHWELRQGYSYTAEISFFYGGRRFHLDLDGERGRCYGPGAVGYRVLDASSALSQLEKLLSI